MTGSLPATLWLLDAQDLAGTWFLEWLPRVAWLDGQYILCIEFSWYMLRSMVRTWMCIPAGTFSSNMLMSHLNWLKLSWNIHPCITYLTYFRNVWDHADAGARGPWNASVGHEAWLGDPRRPIIWKSLTVGNRSFVNQQTGKFNLRQQGFFGFSHHKSWCNGGILDNLIRTSGRDIAGIGMIRDIAEMILD